MLERKDNEGNIYAFVSVLCIIYKSVVYITVIAQNLINLYIYLII